MQITSAVVVAAAGLALLATSSPMGGQTPEAPNPVPRAVGTGSEDLAAGPDKGPSGTERVAITTRPIPLPPAAALAPASPSDLDRGGVLVADAIGKAEPVGVFVESFGTGVVEDVKIQEAVLRVFDLRPAAIIRDLDLLRPIYSQTAAYGHFGRDLPDFTWERTDRVDELKTAAGVG